MTDTTEVWTHTLDRFADLLERIETALELGEWDAPELAEQLVTAPMPALPPDPTLQRRAEALRAEGERLALEIARRRAELGKELEAGGERRTAARSYRRSARLAPA
ncbi:MAG: hypothetical protein AAGD18_12240 [Actinomycetota bacterium]